MSSDLNLPIVDLAAFDDDTQSPRVVQEVVEALSTYGFMYVRGHGISNTALAQALEASRNFFAQASSMKNQFAFSKRGAEGSFAYHAVENERLDPLSAPDLKETFSVRNALAMTDAETWPSDTFRGAVFALYEASVRASYRIMKIMAAGLALPPDFFTHRHLGQNLSLRLLHYPAGLPVTSSQQFGAGAHTDWGSITLLHQDNVGGLEVLGKDELWHAAPAVPDALLVNTGDLMQRWTNDRFVSTVHRVRPISGAADRYSLAFFVDPDSDVQVECIESCAGGLRPARYAAITAGEHLLAKMSEAQKVHPVVVS